jgi:hypothetical protein
MLLQHQTAPMTRVHPAATVAPSPHGTQVYAWDTGKPGQELQRSSAFCASFLSAGVYPRMVVVTNNNVPGSMQLMLMLEAQMVPLS